MKPDKLTLFFVCMIMLSMIPVVSANTSQDQVLIGKTFYVALDGGDANDGLTREHAKRHIQKSC